MIMVIVVCKQASPTYYTDAATLAEASFNDPRCEDGGVCPTDPLLFTCNVTNTSSDRVFLTFSFAEMDLLSLTNNNVTQGAQPDGTNIQSHNVTGVGPYDYILTLSIANASLLNGGMIECDSVVGVTDVAKCPVAGELFVAVNMLFSFIYACALQFTLLLLSLYVNYW